MYQVTLAKRLGQPNAQYSNRQVVFPPMFMWVLCCMQAINDALNGRRVWICNGKFHQAPALGHAFNALHTAICRTNNQTTLNPAFITKSLLLLKSKFFPAVFYSTSCRHLRFQSIAILSNHSWIHCTFDRSSELYYIRNFRCKAIQGNPVVKKTKCKKK